MLTVNQKLSLVLCIFLTAGYLYNLDWPQSLETPLMQQPYLLTSIQYNLIYLATSLPLVVFSIPIGMVMDRLNIRYSVWVVLGVQLGTQVLIAVVFMFFFKGFYAVILMLRIVFGLTSETSFTLQSLMIEKVIKKQNLDLVLNLCYSIPLVFDALNSLVSTQLYDLTLKPYVPLFLGAFVCIISLVCGLIMVRKVEAHQQQKLKQSEQSSIQNDQTLQGQESQEQQNCQIKDIKVVPWEFWVFILAIFMGQSAIGPYFDNLTDLLIKRFGIAYTTAGQLSMIPFGCCPIFSIMLYAIVKKHQTHRRLIIMISNSLCLVAHVTLFLIPNTQQPTTFSYLFVVFSLTCLSCSFAGHLGVLEVSTSMLIPKHLMGTAYGAVAAVNALSMSIIPLLNGFIIESGSTLAIGFRNLQFAYISMSVLYLLLAVFMRFYPSQVFRLLDKVRSDNQQQTIKESLVKSQSASTQ